MTFISIFMLAVGVACASAALTGIVRRYALSRRLMDEPNARSSHSVPTPRAGGLAIVASFLGGALVWATLDQAIFSTMTAVGGAGLLVAAIGFWDDHGHVRVSIRLVSQAASGLWLIYWLKDLPQFQLTPLIPLIGDSVLAELAVLVGCWFGFVWIVNLFNFMDGIDGIAAVEASSVGIGGAVISLLMGFGVEVMAILLASSVLGFLPWNWSPARIFMGDVGSGFLGAILAGITIMTGAADASFIGIWLILMGVFVVDATVTLLRRAFFRERIFDAHRTHAYQNAARFLGSHSKVSIAVLLINCFWLFPIALLCALDWLGDVAGLIVAYAPLVVLSWRWCAGVPEAHERAKPR